MRQGARAACRARRRASWFGGRNRRRVVNVHADRYCGRSGRDAWRNGRRLGHHIGLNIARNHHVRSAFLNIFAGHPARPGPTRLDAARNHDATCAHGSDSQGLRLLRFEPGKRSGLRRGGHAARRDARRRRRRSRLWRRLGRPDGRDRDRACRRAAARSSASSRNSSPGARTCSRRARARRHPRHARAQAHHVRALRRVRGAARRHRHAGGAGRAADLGAARPPPQADPDRQHQRLLGRPARRVRAHEPQPATSIPAARSTIWSTDDVEEILPMPCAPRPPAVSEDEKAGEPETVRRM